MGHHRTEKSSSYLYQGPQEWSQFRLSSSCSPNFRSKTKVSSSISPNHQSSLSSTPLLQIVQTTHFPILTNVSILAFLVLFAAQRCSVGTSDGTELKFSRVGVEASWSRKNKGPPGRDKGIRVPCTRAVQDPWCDNDWEIHSCPLHVCAEDVPCAGIH